jgi:hypothetical protein
MKIALNMDLVLPSSSVPHWLLENKLLHPQDKSRKQSHLWWGILYRDPKLPHWLKPFTHLPSLNVSFSCGQYGSRMYLPYTF